MKCECGGVMVRVLGKEIAKSEKRTFFWQCIKCKTKKTETAEMLEKAMKEPSGWQ